MKVLAWIQPATWPAVVAAARGRAASDSITLVAGDDTDELAPPGIARGLIGRGRPDRDPGLAALATREAQELLAQAEQALGRPCRAVLVPGPVGRGVTEAAVDADLLIVARDGDRRHLGPRSIGRHARFVIDHAPCTVELIWPESVPGLETIPPPPPPGPPPPPPGS